MFSGGNPEESKEIELVFSNYHIDPGLVPAKFFHIANQEKTNRTRPVPTSSESTTKYVSLLIATHQTTTNMLRIRPLSSWPLPSPV